MLNMLGFFELFWLSSSCCLALELHFDPSTLSMQLGQLSNISAALSQPATQDMEFEFTYRDANGIYVTDLNNSVVKPIDPIKFKAGDKGPIFFTVTAHSPGHIYLGLNTTMTIENLDKFACDIYVMHLLWLDILQIVIGWIYFAAWTVSFYPQVYINWRRKSVVGFNLDFLTLNIVGFFVYSIFNVFVYASPVLRQQYALIHPMGVIPVMPNDIFFSVHALAICLVTGIQVLIYERGSQRVSRTCLIILAGIAIYCLINVIIAGVNVISWLSLLYNISYVKLFVTLIKYIPQAAMNCHRKSTVGWSIENICLDMTGGLLSLLQMVIVAYNFDDWSSGFGSPTKLGLGLFSILFDIFFMVQHWGLYRHARHEVDTSGVDMEASTGFYDSTHYGSDSGKKDEV